VWSPSESKKAVYYKTAKIREIARDLKIHESILAGRIRYDTNNFALFPRLLGNGLPSRILDVNLPRNSPE
jgi:hypothetical protein